MDINMFRQLVAWANKRWPEQFVVTMQEYKQLREELGQYNTIIQGCNQLNERLVTLEAQVKRLNDSNGFVNTSKGSIRLER
jgi:cell shape-determining protein MreC